MPILATVLSADSAMGLKTIGPSPIYPTPQLSSDRAGRVGQTYCPLMTVDLLDYSHLLQAAIVRSGHNNGTFPIL